MKAQIQEAIDRSGEKLNGVVSYPSENHLWDMNEECENWVKTRNITFIL